MISREQKEKSIELERYVEFNPVKVLSVSCDLQLLLRYKNKAKLDMQFVPMMSFIVDRAGSFVDWNYIEKKIKSI